VPGASSTSPCGINASGDIVETYFDSTGIGEYIDSKHHTHGFLDD
jgi:hypothetical protein